MGTTRDAVDTAAVELAQMVHRRLSSIEMFTGQTYPKVRRDILNRAVKIVDRLHEREKESLIDEAYGRVVCELLFGDGDPPADFWSTPLGADVAWAIGYPTDDVPPWAAAAVLHCSRTKIWNMQTAGDLTLTADGLRDAVRRSRHWMRKTAILFEGDGSSDSELERV